VRVPGMHRFPAVELEVLAVYTMGIGALGISFPE
jgi:hypothetical protein